MDIRLIAMDLDGTALRKDHRSISPRLRIALEKAHEQGIQIVPVTGRPFRLLPPVLRQDPQWKQYGIVCNGSQIRLLHTGEILDSRPMREKDLHGLLQLAERYQLAVEFSVDSTLYLTQQALMQQQGWPELAFHCQEVLPQNSVVVESLLPMCGNPQFTVEKVNLNGIPDALQGKIKRELAALEVSGVWASACSMEITHISATKGRALQRLCGIIGIPLKQVMAVGDGENDLSMFQTAGLSVAMGNAPECVKHAADAVTQSNEADGAAIAIERFALGSAVLS